MANSLIAEVRAMSRPLSEPSDLDPLLAQVGESRYVLLGEASHGTAEFYTWRAEISRRLIEEKGFSFIAVEGDWPDCFRVNEYVKGLGPAEESARDVLRGFTRWPTWMWANEEVADFAGWLHDHNRSRPEADRVGFYGLDVYSLWESLYAVMEYLYHHAPGTLPDAWQALHCFERYGEDAREYARARGFVDRSCEGEVVTLLRKLREQSPRPGQGTEHEFSAGQNALVLKNAEAYYRTMVRGGPEAWNVRDRHMAETLDRLMDHHGPRARGIVWAHNTHIGDARYTDMADQGEINLGQLVRQRHSREGVALIGFGSYEGTVIAGKRWDAPMERMDVPAARDGSWEDILRRAGEGDKLLLFSPQASSRPWLERRGHRAIGVVYRPEYEHLGNYVPTVLPRRYDAFLSFETTRALRPLHDVRARVPDEVPETFPSGV